MPDLPAPWESPIEMDSVSIQLFENGDPAGLFPAGDGFGNTIQVPCPNAESTYTAGWIGTTTLQNVELGESSEGGGGGGGG